MRPLLFAATTCFVVFSISSSALVAEARSVIRVDENVSILNEQSVAGNFYGVGSTVALSGEVSGDVHVAAGQLTLNGSVASDTLAFAITADIHGDVGDDLRVVASEVTIGGHVRGDLMVIARRLKVLSTAQIDGDLIFFGQEAQLAGAVGREVMGTMGRIHIDGVVGGGVQVTVDAFTLGDRAAVTGDLQYTSAQDLERAPNAVVSGTVLRNEAVSADNNSQALQSVLVGVLSLLFAALTWYLFLRATLEGLVRSATQRYLRSVLVGIAVVAAVPVTVLVLIASGFGALLGWMLLIAYVFMLCAAGVGLIAVLGGVVKMLVAPQSQPNALWVVVGAITALLLMLIPYVGLPLLLVGLIATLGALADRIYRTVR